VLVGAEAIAQNGDVANDAGTYPVAALAARHDVPVIVCAPLAAVDPAAATGAALETAMRPGREILELSKVPLTLLDTPAFNPVVDITPADLVSAWATEEGLIEGAFAEGLRAALERRSRRLPGSLASRPRSDALAAAAPAGSDA
jgi:methylthioribose-1-phosphate isomerase